MDICRIPIKAYKFLNQYGPAFCIVIVFRVLRWKYHIFQIRRRYFDSRSKHRATTGVHDEMPFTKIIVTYGLQEVSELKVKYANLYSEREDLRFLFNIPPYGASHFYCLDLAQCLQHTGISARFYNASTENLEKVLSDFRPTVFLTKDDPFFIKTLDTESLLRYKKQYRLARLFMPYYLSPLKIRRALPSQVEADHISLHRSGKLADAFVCYFENVFWDLFCEPWKNTGRNYYSLPFAANPFRHYPILVGKDFDWGIATANSDLGIRAALTHKYMSRIIGAYSGVIAGHNWGRNIHPIPADQITQFFSRVRISPDIAPEVNVRYPLGCGAKVHELSAMGVFQLTTETEALRKYYSPTEIVGFRSPEEFNALFDYFVDKPEVRHMYIKNGMARTLAENTYFHRIGKLIEVLDQHPDLF